MKLWIVFAFAGGVFAGGGACGSGTPPSTTPANATPEPEIRCKTAVEHAATIVKLRDREVTMTIGECEQQDWPRGARECVNTIKAEADLATCASNFQLAKHGLFAAGGFAEAMKAMRRFKDEMCACKDSACAQRVADEMTKWSQEQAKDQREPPRMSDDDMKLATELGEAMGKCMQAAMGAGGTTP